MSAFKNLLMGRIGNNSHPVHPSTVHLPIAFLITACGLDMAQHTFLSLPALAKPLLAIINASPTAEGSVIPLVHSMSQLSYLATIAFLITSLPALSTGVMELLALIQARGLEDKVTKTALIHAGLNDVALVGMAYNWFTRRNRDAVLSKTSNVLVSASILLGGMYAAYLGGSLVYSHGVGVQRMGDGLKERRAKGEKTPAPEADYAGGLGGVSNEIDALKQSTKPTYEKGQQKVGDARAQLDHGIGEARQRAEGLRQGAEQRAGQTQQQAQYERREL